MALVLRGVDVVPRATAGPEATPTARIVLPPNHAIVPTNADGTVNVRLSAADEIKVDITHVNGMRIYGSQVPVNSE